MPFVQAYPPARAARPALGSQANIPLQRTRPRPCGLLWVRRQISRCDERGPGRVACFGFGGKYPVATNAAPACSLRLPAHCDERRPACPSRPWRRTSPGLPVPPFATNAARAADALRRRCAGRRCLGSSSASSGSALHLRVGQTIRTALGRSQNLGLLPTRRPRRRGRSRARSAPGRSGPSGGPPRSSLP